MLSAKFDKTFYRFKNILCIIDPIENIYNFMLILRNAQSCKKIYDAVQNVKETKDRKQSKVKLFQQLLYPISNEIQSNEALKTEIMPIVLNLCKSFNSKDKQKCFEWLKQIEANEHIFSETFGNIIGAAEELRIDRKRSLRSHVTTGEYNEGVASEPRVYNLDRNVLESSKIVEAPNFKVINFLRYGVPKSRLFIFASNDNIMGYEYFFSDKYKVYRCNACEKMKNSTKARIYKNANGEDYVKLNERKHICKMVNYESRNYDKMVEAGQSDNNTIIIKEPNFKIHIFKNKGISRKWLIVFPLNDDKNKCYEFSWAKSTKRYECLGCDNKKKKRVSAELCQKEDGTNYVKLGPQKHVCEYRKYNPKKFNA
uniref:Uncharacterized protein n=1 Tax=Panagrolaimus davidi TaxID=227884 RepID=A0A914P4Y9_9BILA